MVTLHWLPVCDIQSWGCWLLAYWSICHQIMFLFLRFMLFYVVYLYYICVCIYLLYVIATVAATCVQVFVCVCVYVWTDDISFMHLFYCNYFNCQFKGLDVLWLPSLNYSYTVLIQHTVLCYHFIIRWVGFHQSLIETEHKMEQKAILYKLYIFLGGFGL